MRRPPYQSAFLFYIILNKFAYPFFQFMCTSPAIACFSSEIVPHLSPGTFHTVFHFPHFFTAKTNFYRSINHFYQHHFIFLYLSPSFSLSFFRRYSPYFQVLSYCTIAAISDIANCLDCDIICHIKGNFCLFRHIPHRNARPNMISA